MSPFGGPQYSTLPQKLLAISQQPIPPIRDRRSDVPEALVSVLDKMLAKQPEGRFATSAEMAASLEPLAAGSDLSRLVAEASKLPARGAPTQLQVDSTFDTAASAVIDTHSGLQPPSIAAASVSAAAGRRGGRRTLAAIAMTAAALLAAAGFVIRLATDYGELVVESPEPNLEVIISAGHRRVAGQARTSPRLPSLLTRGLTIRRRDDLLRDYGRGSFAVTGRPGNPHARRNRRRCCIPTFPLMAPGEPPNTSQS